MKILDSIKKERKKKTIMGANLAYITHEDASHAELIEKLFEACEQSRSESGSSYSGEIGMFYGKDVDWVDIPPFATVDDADEYLSDNHRKGDTPMGIRFYVPVKENKAVTKAVNASSAAANAVNKLRSTIVQEITDHTSQFIICKGCQSKMNRAKLRRHLYSLVCPICGNTILNKGQTGRLERANEKQQKAFDNARKVEQEHKGKNGKICWMIGGLVSS